MINAPSLRTHKCFMLPKRFNGAETGVLSVYMDEFDDGARQAHVAGRGRGCLHRFQVLRAYDLGPRQPGYLKRPSIELKET